jgi:hypothetical protein
MLEGLRRMVTALVGWLFHVDGGHMTTALAGLPVARTPTAVQAPVAEARSAVGSSTVRSSPRAA